MQPSIVSERRQDGATAVRSLKLRHSPSNAPRGLLAAVTSPPFPPKPLPALQAKEMI